ncbi:MAG: GAF domain-containing protein [Vicinamibacteria bacterium]
MPKGPETPAAFEAAEGRAGARALQAAAELRAALRAFEAALLEWQTLGDLLRALVARPGASPDGFLRGLVRETARAAGARSAVLTECVEPAPQLPTRVRTLAVWLGRGYGREVEYRLAGTPCEEVVRGGVCVFHPESVRALFPADEDLSRLHAESYLGVPLTSSRGELLGHLALIHDARLARPEEKRWLLELVAERAAGELERRLEARRSEARAARQVRAASGALPGLVAICAWCRQVRDAVGAWRPLEDFLHAHAEVEFTHGICPGCFARESET